MIGLHHGAETFVGTMVLDGVLERHRGLRVGVIELGAGWVPAMLRRLDQIAEIWKRSEPELAALQRTPSAQITEQMGFTPYPFEDVGALLPGVEPRPVPVLQRLPPRRGRPQPDRPVQHVARRLRRRRPGPVLLGQHGQASSASDRGQEAGSAGPRGAAGLRDRGGQGRARPGARRAIGMARGRSVTSGRDRNGFRSRNWTVGVPLPAPTVAVNCTRRARTASEWATTRGGRRARPTHRRRPRRPSKSVSTSAPTWLPADGQLPTSIACRATA